MFNILRLLYIIPFSVDCTLPNWVCCVFVFASIFSYIALLWLIAFLSEIRVYAARKFFTDKMDPDRPRDVMYLKSMLKKNPNSWLTEFINFTWLYGLQACIKQSFKFIFYT